MAQQATKAVANTYNESMRRLLSYSLILAQAAVLSASAATLSGWISDSQCGAGNANGKAESRECAARCIKDGASPVFVSDADQKVYKIAGNAKIMDHLSHKVQVSGDIKGDTITVKGIKAAD